MNINELTIAQAANGLRKKEFSSVELTQACLDQIKERNKTINAFISVTGELAMAEAKKADARIAAGDVDALTGIPYGAKDAICVRDVRATGAAKILDEYTPAHESSVVTKIREQGAVLLGKQNCDAFGHGASNENSMYGPVRNPHDETKVAGGSCGGSAAAVADNQCIFSLAEDTGGSIRQPASLCGIPGLRPSYGRNSRYGIMPMSSSHDTIGPMAKTVEDLALLMEIMAGQDAKDATTVSDAVPQYTKEIQTSVKGMRVGVPKEYYELEGMEDETRALVEAQIELAKSLGCTIVPVSLPYTKYALAAYYILIPSEDSSNLARLDGIRYGSRAQGDTLAEVYAQSREQGFPEEVKRRIMIGTYALSAGYYDAYYRKAQKVRTLIRQDYDRVFTEVDVLITPVSPFPAFGIGEKKEDVLAMYLADVCTVPASVAGIPGLSIPAGMTKNGLPVGAQILGPRMAEARVLQLGHHLEQAQNV